MEPRGLIHTHAHTYTKSNTPGFMASIYLPVMLQIQWPVMCWKRAGSDLRVPPGWTVFCLHSVGQPKKKNREKTCFFKILELWETLSFEGMGCQVWIPHPLFNTSIQWGSRKLSSCGSPTEALEEGERKYLLLLAQFSLCFEGDNAFFYYLA